MPKIALFCAKIMNRHIIITLASIAIIAATLGYSSLNLVSAKQLEFRWQTGSFDLLSILFGGKLLVCNNSDFFANLRGYSFEVIYDKKSLGTFSTDGISIPPHTSKTLAGKFEAQDRRISQILFASLDTAIGDNAAAARVNPDKMSVVATLETLVVGFVPFSITTQYSGEEFVNLMNQKTECD
jgi:hypothetical protein